MTNPLDLDPQRLFPSQRARIQEYMQAIDHTYGGETATGFWDRESIDLVLSVLRMHGEDELADWFEAGDKWYA